MAKDTFFQIFSNLFQKDKNFLSHIPQPEGSCYIFYK